MAYRLNLTALQEDARKIGVGLIIAGIIGTVVENVPLGVGVTAIVFGVLLIIAGALQRREDL